jgi:hypothetical protein
MEVSGIGEEGRRTLALAHGDVQAEQKGEVMALACQIQRRAKTASFDKLRMRFSTADAYPWSSS